MSKPTCEELFEEDGHESVWRYADDSWRHGAYIDEVFRRDSDSTYWRASYCLSSDGEENGLREGDADIVQVEPKQVITTKYVRVKENTK